MSTRALVVDDSRAMRTIIRKILERFGYQVAEAEHGAAALALLADGPPPDVALVDWNMPVVNGLDFVHAVRAESRYAAMRIMMVTSETELDQVARALGAGADEYLMKPFTPDLLRDKLQLLGVGS